MFLKHRDTGTLILSVVFIKTRSLPSLPMAFITTTFLAQMFTDLSCSNVYRSLFSAGRCWLVAAFLPGLTGRAMTSAFLSSAHCQLRWLSQRKHQGKVAQPRQCAITECGCWQGLVWGTLASKVSTSGQSQECAGLPHPSCFSYSFQYRRKLVGCLLSSQTRNQWHPAPSSDSKLTSLSCKKCSSGSACISPLPSPLGC